MIYMLIFLISAAVIVNILSKKYVLYKLTYKREISKKTVEIGEEFEIVTVIENHKILPVTFLQVTEKFPSILNYKFKANIIPATDYIYHKSTMLMMPYQRIKRVYKVFCSKRGRFVLSDVTLTGGDLLGLNTCSKNVEYPQEIIVLPSKADLKNEIIPYGDYNGDFSVRRWIVDDPVLTVGIRDYTGSEPLKTIHWPSSLKSGKLMVKKFDYTSDNRVMVVLNIECSKPFWAGIDNEKIEKCISITRSVIEELEEAGIPYGFTTDAYYNGEFEGNSMEMPGFGTAHYYNIAENLGRVDYNVCMSFEELLLGLTGSTESCTTFVIITPTVFEPYIGPVNSLSEKAMRVVLISLEDDNLKYLKEDMPAFIERRN